MQKFLISHSSKIISFSSRKFFAKKVIKQFQTEDFIKIQPVEKKSTAYPDIKIEIKKYTKEAFEDHNKKLKEEKAIPLSPYLEPLTVENPKICSKKYRWCACGMSTKQPLCDGSHEGTKFKPVRFTIEESCDKIELCGCKFSTNPPFCDGKTCKCLRDNTTNEESQKSEKKEENK